ncbi:molybdate ABC transporter permease subunit [Elioraea tepida]|jgi:molybdate transport system permease protein|uniref:Molybdenum transport system permease n=1 Tax=Elioraea tepida TaxID=2843330 RepID=A0A975U5A0_9PROT|nr:molybdate ABC transporter permease subunit [Elioraea tepida]QXM25993.1 molybdate ABC transporter permease subunit [Elioraea tepida]
MDWEAFLLSAELGLGTVVGLAPLALWLGRVLAYRSFRGKGVAEALVALPLLLPPTVVGFYLLLAFGRDSPLGAAFEAVTGRLLAFSFEGLLLASILVNIPFAVQPAQRAFESIEPSVREAGAVSGLSPWQVFLRIELPLAWPGLVTGIVLAFAHTIGEFGVVLMVGGSIPGETRTVAIAIYDRVQAFDDRGAGIMAATLLALSVLALAVTNTLARRIGRRHG